MSKRRDRLTSNGRAKNMSDDLDGIGVEAEQGEGALAQAEAPARIISREDLIAYRENRAKEFGERLNALMQEFPDVQLQISPPRIEIAVKD